MNVSGGGAVTVIVDVPNFASLSIVIATVPPPMAVTSPALLTVAIDTSWLRHVNGRPVSVAPFASFTVALSCTVAFTAKDALGGATVTVATGTRALLLRFPDPVTVEGPGPHAFPENVNVMTFFA